MPGEPTFDLQSHSLASDGALPARDVVAAAAQAGVQLLALSDHDTVEGVDEARQAARQLGVTLVSATEISAVEGEHQDLHILGYGVDDHDGDLRERLADYRHDRERRADAMAHALRELGYALDEQALADRRAAGLPIGRPHLADAVVDHPDNAARLADEGLAERSAFLVAYLIEGRPAFARRARPTVPEAIQTIHAAGGVAVWAHPFWDVKDPDEVTETIARFSACGLDGVECFYITHDHEQTDLLVERCREGELLMTGSSDFHGPEHRHFARFRAFDTYGHDPVLGPIGS